MDNNAFETEMINRVNNHATDAMHNRMVAESAARERNEHNHRVDVVRALVEIVCLVMCLVAIAYAVSALNLFGKLTSGIAVPMTTVVSFVIGMRVNALARIIKK